MQNCLLLLGIVLFGQTSHLSGPRYANDPAAAAVGSAAANVGSSTRAGTAAASQLEVVPSARQDGTGEPSLPGSQPLGNSQRPPATAVREAPVAAAASPPTVTVPPSSAATTPLEASSADGTSRLSKVDQPTELLRSLVNSTVANKLAGRPLTLAEAVQSATSRAEQTRRVNLYWELSHAVAEYHLVALEAVQLNAIYSGLGLQQPSSVWLQAQATIEARSQVAQGAARALQLRLNRELDAGSGDAGSHDAELPLPSDLPHCGAYATRFEKIFQGRSSSEARQLSQLLPLLHQTLRQRGKDVVAAHQWYNRVSQQRRPQSDGLAMLRAYQNLSLQRSAFVATAYRYNANIARYTALAVPQNVDTVRLVAMLIQSAREPSGGDRQGPAWQSGGIRRATDEQALPAVGQQLGRPRTYAQQERNRALRVPANKQGVEHSILVPPRSQKP